MQILLHHGTGLLNSLIRWQTRSHYAHASVLLRDDDNVIVQSLPGKGVHVTRLSPDDWRGVDRFVLCEPFDEAAVSQFLLAQVGKKYDYSGVLRFLTREKSPDNKRWFCSELVFAAFVVGHCPLLNCREAYKISPALLELSPYLVKLKRLK
jgi:uncharacterized protein YycO